MNILILIPYDVNKKEKYVFMNANYTRKLSLFLMFSLLLRTEYLKKKFTGKGSTVMDV